MEYEQALKLTVYLNESLRSGGELACDRLMALCERRRVRIGVLLRGIEGFGAHRRLHADRLEAAALSQPAVAVAVDSPATIELLAREVEAVLPSGLVTTERAWLLGPAVAGGELPPVAPGASVRLTVYCGRGERAGGRLAHRAMVDHLQATGLEAATVFLGVDGTVGGRRRRARFFSANRDVPVMILAVGGRAQVRSCLPGIERFAQAPIVTVEGITVCKRDGLLIAAPPAPPVGGEVARKLMVWAAGGGVHGRLVTGLRQSGCTGATSLRGVWGFRGDGQPHGDSVRSLRRSGPVVTVTIDREGGESHWRLVDELTAGAGMVTAELIPVHRGTAR